MRPIHSVTTDSTEEPFTLPEMRRHVGLFHDQKDREIKSCFAAARDWLERQYNRTFRATVARRVEYSSWPMERIYLDYPPLTSVDSIKYYDVDNSLQTLATSQYIVVTSTLGKSFIEWTDLAVLPDHYDRANAVQVNYTTGYVSREAVPEIAKNAIKVLAYAWFNDDEPQKIEAAQKAAGHLMSAIDTGFYT